MTTDIVLILIFRCSGGAFVFSFDISTAYPHDAPKVKCKTKVRLHVAQNFGTWMSCNLFPSSIQMPRFRRWLALIQRSLTYSSETSIRVLNVSHASALSIQKKMHEDRCQRAVKPFFDMQVFHPNIDLEGNVCLNILREDWKPVLSINSVLFGLSFLFMVSFPKAALYSIFFILYSVLLQ